MNKIEKNMLKILQDLKENHHVVGVKAEFEAEGTRFEEAIRLKEVVTKAGLDLTIKIGGCEALKDMYEAKIIGANVIVAPMIESAYAMQKYVQATNLVFSKDEREDIKFLINIETPTGYSNLDSILENPSFNYVSGIVLGRGDMASSMGLNREDVNNEKMFQIADSISQKMFKLNKEMVIGGSVSVQSIPFFRNLKPKVLSKFETRKIIFDAQKALEDSNVDKGILKAIGFELMWLKNKRDFYGMIYKEDEQRLETLEARYKNLLQVVDGVCI